MQKLPESNYQDYFVRVSNGENYKSAIKYNAWGVNPSNTNAQHMFEVIAPGDKLWFVKCSYKVKNVKEPILGHILGCATYVSHTLRNESACELVDDVLTNEDLGWNDIFSNNVLLHYTQHYQLEKCNVFVPNLAVSSYTNNIKPDGTQYMELNLLYKHLVMFEKANKIT